MLVTVPAVDNSDLLQTQEWERELTLGKRHENLQNLAFSCLGHLQVYVSMYICVYVYTHICICVYVCVYIYIYIWIDSYFKEQHHVQK